MQNIVIATYLFPPAGGKAVQRISKLAKYLPSYGWNPIIFTMPLTHTKEVTDRSLLDELPPDIEIHRPQFIDWWSLVPHDIRKYLYHPLPDRYIAWSRAVAGDLVRLIEHTNARALITTSPSHSTQMLGLAAKQKTGIPWIADFRDQWTGHPDFSLKREQAQVQHMEREVLSDADWITTTAPCTKRDFEAHVSGKKITVIENGYDPDDFLHIDLTACRNPSAPLRIGYNGTTSGFHDPTALLEAATNLLKTGNIDTNDLKIVFTGAINMKQVHPYQSLIDRGILDLHGYTAHNESLTRMATMDVSLLLITRGEGIIPGKVFEYLYLSNPILLLGIPGDDLSRLIEQDGSGTVVDHQDVNAVTAELKRLIELKRHGQLVRLKGDRPSIQRFSRREIAGRFSSILDILTGTGSPSPPTAQE